MQGNAHSFCILYYSNMSVVFGGINLIEKIDKNHSMLTSFQRV